MTQYLLMLASAFLIAVVATPLIRRLAIRIGLVDMPAARKVHTEPMPLLGGLAIYVAFLVTLLLFGDRGHVRQVVGIFVGATICALMGLWDDRRDLSALFKLGGQILASVILMLSGVRVQLGPYPVLNVPITLFWTVGITNALNLLDNMDGLCGGIAAIAAAFFLLLAAMNGQYLVGALAASLLGACIGFLVYNAKPASIFMGDVGTLFLGFMLAAVGIKLRFPGQPLSFTWIIPIMVLGVPIFDTSLVFFSRLRRGCNPLTTPGKDHVSHRLVAEGFTQREAVFILYLAACGLGIMAMYLTQAGETEAFVVSGLVLLFAAWEFIRFEVQREVQRPEGQIPADRQDGPDGRPASHQHSTESIDKRR